MQFRLVLSKETQKAGETLQTTLTKLAPRSSDGSQSELYVTSLTTEESNVSGGLSGVSNTHEKTTVATAFQAPEPTKTATKCASTKPLSRRT